MTSKVDNHDAHKSATSTNQKRRHSTGQSQRSKVMTAEGDTRRISDDHQHSLTNGHCERRHSTEASSKPSDNNKENSQAQKAKDDNCTEKKKKKKRKKKKGGYGGASATPGSTNERKGNSNESGRDIHSAENGQANSSELETETARVKGNHSSSEDTPGSAPPEAWGESETGGSGSLDRGAVSRSIDEAARIDKVSTGVNGFTNTPVRSDVGEERALPCCEEQELVLSQQDTIEQELVLSQQDTIEQELVLSQQDTMSDGDRTMGEGSSVDGAVAGSWASFNVQEGSSLSHGEASGNNHSVGDHIQVSTSDGAAWLSDPLKVKDATFIAHPYVFNNLCSSEASEGDNSVKIETKSRSSGHNSEVDILHSKGREEKCEENNIGNKATGENGCEQLKETDVSAQSVEHCHIQSDHSSLENGLSTSPNRPLALGGFSSPADDNDSTDCPSQPKGLPVSRPKRDISIVDLIGSRATAGSAIRAGIIQDKMLNSGSFDYAGQQDTAANSPDSKSDVTEGSEKSPVSMTQQTQEPEATSNVDSPGLENERRDSSMEEQKLKEHQQRDLDYSLGQTIDCERPSGDSEASADSWPEVDVSRDAVKHESQEKPVQLSNTGKEPTRAKTQEMSRDPTDTAGLTTNGDTEHAAGPEASENPPTSRTEWHDQAMINLQAHAQTQQAKANLMITSLRARLRKRELELHDLREGHDRQLSAVVAHLLRLEGEMQKEQHQVLAALADRDDIIRRQRAAIEDLTEKNDRLIQTLKESQQYVCRNKVPQQNGDVCIRDHGNNVVIRNTKGRSSGRSLKSNSGEFKASGEKPKNRFTSAMLERLRRHKSSLELYRAEPMEPLLEGHLRYYSSQDNLVGDVGGARQHTDNRTSGDSVQKKQRCQSLVDYPFGGDLEEEDEKGSSESFHDEGFSSSPARISRHDSGLSSSMSSLAGSGEAPNWTRRWSAGGGGEGQSAESPPSPPSPTSSAKTNVASGPHTATSSSPSSSSSYGFTELTTKSRSVPHSLPTVSENDLDLTGLSGADKVRPHSLTSVEVVSGHLTRSNSVSSPNLVSSPPPPAPSTSSPASSSSSTSDSNPFKSFKNVFKRRGSKKKRGVGLNPPGHQEHSETVKNYFKKHDLN